MWIKGIRNTLTKSPNAMKAIIAKVIFTKPSGALSPQKKALYIKKIVEHQLAIFNKKNDDIKSIELPLNYGPHLILTLPVSFYAEVRALVSLTK